MIDECVETMKIIATTLDMDKENCIQLLELSKYESVKVGWDTTTTNTMVKFLLEESKSTIVEQFGILLKLRFISNKYFEKRTKKIREYAQALYDHEIRGICNTWTYLLIFEILLPKLCDN